VSQLQVSFAFASIGVLALALSSTGCTAQQGDEPGNDTVGEASDEALSYTLGTASTDPFSKDACNAGTFTETWSPTTLLEGKKLRYKLVVEKRDCTAESGCGDWKKQTSLFGLPLTGTAAPSPASSSLGYFLRFDGRASQGERLRLECHVEQAVENDYDRMPWGSILCGAPLVVSSTDNGPYASPEPQTDGPYFNLQGALSGNCFSVATPVWSTDPIGRASAWTEWKAALRTDF
jgi:hypothetical protein